MDGGHKKTRKPNPKENAFPLSAATFWYTFPIFILGFKRDLIESDLTETLTEHQSSVLGNVMEKAWKDEEIRAKKNMKCSLRRVLFRVFGWEFMFYGLVLAISEAIRIAQPLALGKLLQFYAAGNTAVSKNDAYLYAGLVTVCSLGNVLLVHPYMLGVLHLGMKMRVGCCSLIYRKCLKLSKVALGQTTIGQVVNLLSNDVNRFDVALIFAHQLWIGPLETIIVTYLLYLQMGISSAIGVVVLLLFVPLQMYLGKRISVVRLKTALRTDERVRLMSEIISGIQVIKMYAWEIPFNNMVTLARRYEIKCLKNASYMRGTLISCIIYVIRISIFSSILAYVLLGNSITAEKAFVLTSFYNILRQSMTIFFPQGIAMVAEANVSINRLNKYMHHEENHLKNKEIEQSIRASINGVNSEKKHEDRNGIFIENITAKWSDMSSENTLSDVNISATPGALLAIIGPVGSGKSSLLHAILNELPLVNGSITVQGVISYASQEPWLFAGSVRQNILFGLPMDKLRYNNIVNICALERDFTILPFGDRTIVGDRGVSLSGGQRARINLARAVYKQADIYLLDDPLSAVDAHVGKELFEMCITGYLKDKTVILITHQLQYLKEVGHIIFIDDGVIRAEGTFSELQQSALDFTKLLGSNETEDKNAKIETKLNRQLSIRSVESEEAAPEQVEEQMGKGSIGSDVYFAYLKAGGNGCIIFLLALMFIFPQLFASAADYFITYWVNLEQKNDRMLEAQTGKIMATNGSDVRTSESSDDFWNFSRDTCIYIYSAIIGLLIAFTLLRTYMFFKTCMRASTRLHDNMFKSITLAAMRFFNTNSAGRILNRFSKDMGSVDEMLPGAMLDCLQIGLQLIGIIVVVAVVSPLLMIPTVIMGIIFYLARLFYLKTSRDIKRLEGTTRSPVFSHLNATLQGITTIRAFGAEGILIKEFDNHQDLHSSAWFVFISTSRAFGYWLDLICIIYIIFVTFSFLLIGNETYGGNVGLAITQAISITGMLQWGMRQSTELENQMTSVERIVEYSSIEHEGVLESDEGKKPSAMWPERGAIEFKNVSLYYFLEEPPVLRSLSFSIKSKEKIGIVGRTGAGKSSLIASLFQLTNTEGEIIIDDVNISTIGLHDLRSKISIIPQEPVLFSGTMRKNLDPFDEYSDTQLWRALEDVELKESVLDLTSGLNSKMSEGGSNFSVGQRQLVCLARAILRNNRILVLDEATANVDPQTDGLIQTTIRKKFAECTVLTIAHRLHTVMDSDKVLVMDAGKMQEFAHPFELLQNETGVLYQLVQQTGKPTSQLLYHISEASFNKKLNIISHT